MREGGFANNVQERQADLPALRARRRPAGRFLFYSHDGLGLGHVRRNLAIAAALAERMPRAAILVATGSDEVERLGVPERVDVLKLPGLRKLGNGHYGARRLLISRGDVRAVRARLLAAAAETFRPAVVLADKHPFGAGEELAPALLLARQDGARAVLGLRDVLDEPDQVAREWRGGRLVSRIRRHYDRILVYGQREVHDAPVAYGFPAPLAAMTTFCGYVRGADGPNALLGPVEGPPDGPRVLATAGGGADGFALLSAFVESAAGQGWQALVVAGPHADREDAERLGELAAAARVGYRRFVPGLASAFPSLDALVCMGGYNTLVEAAASGVPTVCVPRVHPRREQLIRARAFARLGLVDLLEPHHVRGGGLRQAIEDALAERPAQRPILDLGGAARAAEQLAELASGRPRRRAARVAAGVA